MEKHFSLSLALNADGTVSSFWMSQKPLFLHKVQRGGKNVTAADVAHARSRGATDLEIHDTVLIAAAFCIYNRYVDGLETTQPHDDARYRERGRMVAREGYIAGSKNLLPAEAATR